MKELTKEEFEAATGTKRVSMISMYVTALVREFTASGYEACEVEPEDLHNIYKFGDVSKSTLTYVRTTFNKVVVALKLEEIVGMRVSKGHIFLYRKDI